jgi:hypothetical protein
VFARVFDEAIMKSMLHSSFFWQMSSGFVLGVVGMIALQPAEATRNLLGHVAALTEIAR